MFRNTPTDTEHIGNSVLPTPSDVLPLSYLALNLGEPVEGWAAFLGRRAIAIVPDHLGRDSIGLDAARRLLDEKRADELQARASHAEQEREPRGPA